MAAPNLANVATITAKSVQAALDTTLTTEILEVVLPESLKTISF